MPSARSCRGATGGALVEAMGAVPGEGFGVQTAGSEKPRMHQTSERIMQGQPAT